MSARIAPAQPPYPSAIQTVLDQMPTPGEQPLSLFRTLACDERLFSRFAGGALLDPGHLSLPDRELVIHRICALNGAAYEWGVHAAIFAEMTGLDAPRLAATTQAGIADCWSPHEALLIAFCDAVNAQADIDDPLWARLSETFDEPARIELMMLAGFYRTVSLLVNALRLEPEPFAIAFPRA